MYMHKIVNAETGEETLVELSAAEIAIIEANIAKSEVEEAAFQAKSQARSALLERLGLTEEEAAILLS